MVGATTFLVIPLDFGMPDFALLVYRYLDDSLMELLSSLLLERPSYIVLRQASFVLLYIPFILSPFGVWIYIPSDTNEMYYIYPNASKESTQTGLRLEGPKQRFTHRAVDNEAIKAL